MTTSSFKSATKRTPIGNSSYAAEDAGSTNRNSAHRRTRSLSRFSRRFPSNEEEFDDAPARRFINTMRGSGFPDISLDDLAIEFFESGIHEGSRGRSTSRNSDVSPNTVASASLQQRRGRSVSRHSSRVGREGTDSLYNSSGGGRVVPKSNPRERSVSRHSWRTGSYRSCSVYNSPGRVVQESNLRKRRSISVVPGHMSDTESDLEHSQNSGGHPHLKTSHGRNKQMPLSHRLAISNHRQVLRRSHSQRDLKSHDGYSSHSSALTDNEGRDSPSKNVVERTIRAVYAQKAEHPNGDHANSGLYAAMRREIRHAVEEIRMELEQAIIKKDSPIIAGDYSQSNNSDGSRDISTIKRNFATQLGQSERQKEDLLAEILLEEKHDRNLSKVAKELVPGHKNTYVAKKPLRARKRSNDRSSMSKHLTEEAEKYFEDFISNVEDTDISSLDGERSDRSSTLVRTARPETFQGPYFKSAPVGMDGVALPWLQWETTTDASPLPCKTKGQRMATNAAIRDAVQDVTNIGTWRPGLVGEKGGDAGSACGENGSYKSQPLLGETRLQVDMDEYLNAQRDEDQLVERWRQQLRINSGSLLLCNHTF